MLFPGLRLGKVAPEGHIKLGGSFLIANCKFPIWQLPGTAGLCAATMGSGQLAICNWQLAISNSRLCQHREIIFDTPS
jgi:hypothetical protein